MPTNLGQYSKELSVAGLMVFWLLMDLLHVDDQALRYCVIGLITTITGWHGINNLPAKPTP